MVECDDIDVLREPRLIEADKHHAGKSVQQVVYEIQELGKVVMIAMCKPCPFLAANCCSIYPTRPGVCVGFSAGSDQCQDCRQQEGLPPLLPIEVDSSPK